MKNIITKLSYMALGGLLTLIGYHFGNIENHTADAQVAADEVKDVIRCRKLIIVGKKGGGILDIGRKDRIVLETTDMDRGSISIYSDDGLFSRILLGVASDEDTGFLNMYRSDDNPGIQNNLGVQLGVGTDGGRMTLYNKERNKGRNTAVFQAGVTTDGHGYAVTLDRDSQHTDALGPKEGFQVR